MFCTLDEAVRDHYAPEDAQVGKALIFEQDLGFGFQAHGAGAQGHLVIAAIGDTDERALTARVNASAGTRTVSPLNFLGRSFLTIHHHEWEKIPQVFQAVLDDAEKTWLRPFIPVGKLEYTFKHGERFSWTELEHRFVTWIEAECSDEKTFQVMYRITGQPKAWLRPWNWHTVRGQQFARKLQRLVGDMSPKVEHSRHRIPWFREACSEHNILHGCTWSSYEAGGYNPFPPICVVCLESPVDTLVLPCMHSVVCKTCSEKLANTPDAHVCVRCRKPLTEVMSE